MTTPTDAIMEAVKRQARKPKAISRLERGRIEDHAAAFGYPLASVIADLAMRLEAAQAIIDKLPKTADGVPIVPGMTVYRISQSGCLNEHVIGRIGVGEGHDYESFRSQVIGDLYSTAALAAANTKGE